VADGDGVIDVRRAHTEDIARFARMAIDNDTADRTKLYEKPGPPKDKVC